MVKALALLMLSVTVAHAGEGMVVVLEAPLFRAPDVSAEVIQYVRKGDKVYVHPVVFNDRNQYSDVIVKQEVWDRHNKSEQDTLPLNLEIARYYDGMDFIPVKDKQGRDAWMLKEHVHVWYEDKREWAQKDPKPDPTDYRLLEPLPEGYPLIRKENLRGAMAFSLGTPFTRNYPYNEKIVADNYGFQLELSGHMMKPMNIDQRSRWFIGGMITGRTVESTYTLETRRSTETWTRFGGGPIVSYDAWKTETQRVTISTALLVYPYTQVNIAQVHPDTGEEEARNYWGWNFANRSGVQWQGVKLIGDLDLVAGIWGEFETPYTLNARTGTNRPEWWGGGKDDSFNTSVTFTLAGIVGLQSSY